MEIRQLVARLTLKPLFDHLTTVMSRPAAKPSKQLLEITYLVCPHHQSRWAFPIKVETQS